MYATTSARLPFTTACAHKYGLTSRGLRTAVANETVRRVLRGVYVDAEVPDTEVLRATALSLVIPADGVACRTTAAWLYGIPPLRISDAASAPVMEVLRPAGTAAVRRPGTAGLTGILDADEIRAIGPVRVTSPARTAIDCARWFERQDALAYLDAMLNRGLITQAQLVEALSRYARRRWIEQARELVACADGRAESPGESWMRLRHLDAGFPRPTLQIPFTDRSGRIRAYLDAGLPEFQLGLEYDGEEFHGPQHQRHDSLRRRWILDEHGWDVIVFRKGDVLGRRPAFEEAIAERLGVAPRLLPERLRRRTWLGAKRRMAAAGAADVA